jgi:hypothetical protein
MTELVEVELIVGVDRYALAQVMIAGGPAVKARRIGCAPPSSGSAPPSSGCASPFRWFRVNCVR